MSNVFHRDSFYDVDCFDCVRGKVKLIQLKSIPFFVGHKQMENGQIVRHDHANCLYSLLCIQHFIGKENHNLSIKNCIQMLNKKIQ